ncbi:hypothetical protein R5R35_012274 [Gryllus longicercus]|uniref:CLIP domain-containing serine protease n=1 Tax=Gryllus longicercus TaxID=2509291 RepID=A0AAN9Z502_9ORTH
MSPSCGSREPGIAALVALCLLGSTSPAAGAHYIRGYEGDECLTPQRVRGVCLVIGKCPSLLNLVSQRPSQQNLAFLNTLRCGFSGSVPIVCCTDGVPGQSTTVQRPPHTAPTSSSSFTRPAPPARPSSTRLTPAPTQRPAPPAPPVPGDAPPDVSAHPNLRLLPEDYCSPQGIDRIVGGNVTDVFAYPWIARLGYLSRRSTWRPVRYFCGGSLINSRYVLTAAHCIITQTDLYLATVKLGEHTIDKPIDCRPGGACLPPPIDVQVEETKVHPLYDPKDVGSHHDIALARLAAPVDFLREEFVRPVCLPSSRDNQLLRLSGPLVAAGWGLTEDKEGSNALKDVLLPVMPYEQCRKVFTQPGLEKEIIPQQLCAGGVAGMDSCNGDSGGPLVLEADVGSESKQVLFGIVSFGHNECGTAGVPGVYTRVAYYMKWILDTIRP